MKSIEKASVAQANDFVSRVRVSAVRLALDTLDNIAATPAEVAFAKMVLRKPLEMAINISQIVATDRKLEKDLEKDGRVDVSDNAIDTAVAAMWPYVATAYEGQTA